MATVSDAPQAIPTPRKPRPRWYSRFLGSSVGGKYVVALTGLALTGFVLVHMLGNLQVFLGRDAYNRYAHGLQELGPLLWVARGGLLMFFLVHIFIALRLQLRNAGARPNRYVYERTKRASLPSRYMALTGVTILLFVIFHLAHFTFGVVDRVEDRQLGQTVNYRSLTDPAWKDPVDPTKHRHDTYAMFVHAFRNVPVVILYIVCQLLLGMHMIHGVRSSFQTLGINSVKINSALNLLGDGVTIVVVGANILMPLAVLFGLIGSDVPR